MREDQKQMVRFAVKYTFGAYGAWDSYHWLACSCIQPLEHYIMERGGNVVSASWRVWFPLMNIFVKPAMTAR